MKDQLTHEGKCTTAPFFSPAVQFLQSKIGLGNNAQYPISPYDQPWKRSKLVYTTENKTNSTRYILSHPGVLLVKACPLLLWTHNLQLYSFFQLPSVSQLSGSWEMAPALPHLFSTGKTIGFDSPTSTASQHTATRAILGRWQITREKKPTRIISSRVVFVQILEIYFKFSASFYPSCFSIRETQHNTGC